MERKLGQPPQHIKKQTHHLADKSPCDSWTIKKAECQRTEVFELWCQRRLLKVAWTARRSNQSILKKIIPEYSLEGLMVKLKLQYSGHLMQRANSLQKTLMWRKTEGRRRKWWQRMRWLDGITLNGHESEQTLKDRGAWRTTVHRVTKSWTWLSGYNNKAFFPLQNSREDSPPVWGLTTAYKHKLETAINTSSSAYSLAIDKLKSQEWLQMRKIRKWREEGRGTDGGGWEKGNNLRTTMWESRLGFMYVTQFNHTTTLSSVIVLIL